MTQGLQKVTLICAVAALIVLVLDMKWIYGLVLPIFFLALYFYCTDRVVSFCLRVKQIERECEQLHDDLMEKCLASRKNGSHVFSSVLEMSRFFVSGEEFGRKILWDEKRNVLYLFLPVISHFPYECNYIYLQNVVCKRLKLSSKNGAWIALFGGPYFVPPGDIGKVYCVELDVLSCMVRINLLNKEVKPGEVYKQYVTCILSNFIKEEEICAVLTNLMSPDGNFWRAALHNPKLIGDRKLIANSGVTYGEHGLEICFPLEPHLVVVPKNVTLEEAHCINVDGVNLDEVTYDDVLKMYDPAIREKEDALAQLAMKLAQGLARRHNRE